MDKLRAYLVTEGLCDDNIFNQKVIGEMNEILRLVFLQVKDQLEAKFGCFEIFGCDFLLQDDLSPVLMEFTSNPSYSFEYDDSREFMRNLLRDVITMAADLHEDNVTRANKAYVDKVFRCA